MFDSYVYATLYELDMEDRLDDTGTKSSQLSVRLSLIGAREVIPLGKRIVSWLGKARLDIIKAWPSILLAALTVAGALTPFLFQPYLPFIPAEANLQFRWSYAGAACVFFLCAPWLQHISLGETGQRAMGLLGLGLLLELIMDVSTYLFHL